MRSLGAGKARIGLRSLTPRRGATAVAAVTLGLAGFGTLLVPPAAASAAPPAQGISVTQAPLPADAGANPQFYSASATCPATGQCVMVGTYYDGSNKPWGVIELQSGTTWSAVEAPEPSNAGSGANQSAILGSAFCGVSSSCSAVSCPSSTSCVTVGSYVDTGGHVNGLIDTQGANNVWSSLQAAVPANAGTGSGQFAVLNSIHCSSSTSCVAVGSYQNTAGRTEGLIDVLSGSTWTGFEAPVPGDAGTLTHQFSRLTELACGSATSCVAIGQYEDTSTKINGLIDTWNGTTWTAATTPVPPNSGTDLDGNLQVQPMSIACASPTSCQLVGIYFSSVASGGHNLSFIDTLTGSTWASIQGPQPSDASTGVQNIFLFRVSCPTATACVAVGNYLNSAGQEVGLVDTLAGTTWSSATAPLPSNAATGSSLTASLNDVDCSTAFSCMATGTYSLAGSNGFAPLAETLANGQWKAIQVPVPANVKIGATNTSIGKSVACASPVACIISGSYVDTGTHTQGFLVTFTGLQGYWLAASDGGIFTFGNAQFFGSTGGITLNKPIVGMASSPDGQGYWLVATDGGVFSFGNAVFHGSTGALRLNRPIVGMAATPDGKGYWLVASDGGIFSFGTATFHGSTGGIVLNKPIVGMAATPDGLGYWLVATDGGIFSFGDAVFYGSTGAIHLNQPIVGMGATPNGDGYWLVASDGGIFTFGAGVFYGSTGAIVLNKPIVGMASSPSGHGYWLVATDGGIFSFGDAIFYGSTGAIHLNKPIVGMAT